MPNLAFSGRLSLKSVGKIKQPTSPNQRIDSFLELLILSRGMFSENLSKTVEKPKRLYVASPVEFIKPKPKMALKVAELFLKVVKSALRQKWRTVQKVEKHS